MDQYAESTNSSPRSRQAEAWDEPLPPVPGAKLRLMCSYGGHIIPRPHDKSLCYVGGDTRIVVVERGSSLSELTSRLSQTLLNGRHFSLKYQLPTEELDSLISVTTDEDLENMVEEYDRTTSSSPLRPSRLRLFLFLSKPETAASMGCLLADAKSETWFVDALNNAGLRRGHSDSATEGNNIVDLDGIPKSDSNHQNEAIFSNSNDNNNKQPNKNDVQDFHYTIPDSQVVIETNASSFDSSVSSPSMANLPPIKVRVNNKMFGLEEQLSQINVIAPHTQQKQEDGLIDNVPPHLMNSGAQGEVLGQVISDNDEKLDHGAQPGIRKPPLPLQLVPRKTGDGYGLSSPDSRHAGGFNLASPDSVASDSSNTSAASFSKQATNQDATQAMPHPQQQQQQQQQQQPQFIQANTHYFHHPTGGPVPISSYYPMYTPPSQQPVHQQMTDQQYPMYLLPYPQAQPYNTIANASAVAPSQPPNLTPYKEALPPIYPTKAPVSSKPEPAPNAYRTGVVQVPSNQFQQQYFGLSQVPPPPPATSISPAPAASANYGYDYSHPTPDQVYYAQHPVAPFPSQYQTMNPNTAVLLTQASSQIAAENAMQQANTSQPL